MYLSISSSVLGGANFSHEVTCVFKKTQSIVRPGDIWVNGNPIYRGDYYI
jgi:hypothetical protein